MDIRTAMGGLVTLEAGLTISDPLNLAIRRAYPYFPDRRSVLPDTPCWTNGWTLTRIDDGFADNRRQFYTVNAQLFILDADMGRAAEIATAFHVALIDALDADDTLGGTVTNVDLRGGDPTLALLEWAGQGYVGLNLYFDLELFD